MASVLLVLLCCRFLNAIMVDYGDRTNVLVSNRFDWRLYLGITSMVLVCRIKVRKLIALCFLELPRFDFCRKISRRRIRSEEVLMKFSMILTKMTMTADDPFLYLKVGEIPVTLNLGYRPLKARRTALPKYVYPGMIQKK
jgi:hypothetical protein